MTRKTAAESRRARGRRPFGVGFLVGFVVTVPATLLALMFSWGERLSGFLLPGTFLLRPSPSMADGH
jgi:hypothetical protein